MSAPNPTIGVLLISTWKYNRFIDNTIAGIRKHFFSKSGGVKIFLHTDSAAAHDADVKIYLPHKPWPEMALNRFKIFLDHQDKYDVDHLFYLDIDVDVVGAIDEEALHDFAAVAHYGYIGTRGTPETNPESAACIYPNENLTYVCSGFFGGKKQRIIAAAKEIQKTIEKDLQKNIIAVWHDESHFNRYVVSHASEIVILDHKYVYCYANVREHNHRPDPRILPYTDQQKGFDKFNDWSDGDIKPLYVSSGKQLIQTHSQTANNVLYLYVTHQAVFANVWRRVTRHMRQINCVDYLFICGFNRTLLAPDQRTLFLNCNDHYEGLPEKMFMAYKFLATSPDFSAYKYIVKIDADSKLVRTFDAPMLDLLDSGVDYGGKIISSANRRYHIGRCSPGSYHNYREYSGPCGHPFCQGGPGYVLSRRAINLLKNEIPSGDQIYEDMCVGLLLRKYGILPTPIPVGRYLRFVGWSQ